MTQTPPQDGLDEPDAHQAADPTQEADEPGPVFVPDPNPTLSAGAAWAAALAVTVATAIVIYFAFSPDRTVSNLPFFGLGALYTGISVLAVLRLKRRDELHLLKPRSGDLTFGALVAFVLFGMTFVVQQTLAVPGTARHGWILRVYALLGYTLSDNRLMLAVGAGLVGLLEELAWRGFVTPLLEERNGFLKANVASVLLYAAAHLPAMFVLRDNVAGLNPLLPMAALGCGLAWSYLRWRMERLPPVLFSHALFTWAVAEFPLWA